MKGYRTLLSNGLIAALSAVEVITGEVIAVDDQTAIIAGALAIMNIVWRFVTTGPVGEK
jgi:hypothetical protein